MNVLKSISENFYGDKLEFLKHSLMFVNQKDMIDEIELFRNYN